MYAVPGRTDLLLRLLERSFGCLGDTIRQQVKMADADILLLWGGADSLGADYR